MTSPTGSPLSLVLALSASVLAQSPEPRRRFRPDRRAGAVASRRRRSTSRRLPPVSPAPGRSAFLPDGNYLITQNGGTMRIVKPNGFVSAPVEGVPGVKTIGAHGLHDLLLDPDFARNRTLYFTYFAPPPGEAPGAWPLHYLYEDVWTKPPRRAPVAADRHGEGGARPAERGQPTTRGRARSGGWRRAAHPVGTRWQSARSPVPIDSASTIRISTATSANRLLDPDERRNFAGGVLRAVGRDGSIPKDNPFLGRANVSPWVYAFGLKDPEGAAVHPVTGDLWVIGPRPAGRRRDRHHQGGRRLRLARRVAMAARCDARPTDGAHECQSGERQHLDARTSKSPSTTGCRRSDRRA